MTAEKHRVRRPRAACCTQNAIKSRDMFEEMGNEQGMEPCCCEKGGGELEGCRAGEPTALALRTIQLLIPQTVYCWGLCWFVFFSSDSFSLLESGARRTRCQFVFASSKKGSEGLPFVFHWCSRTNKRYRLNKVTIIKSNLYLQH